MRDNFDLHKWKEYQLFLNEQEEFTFSPEDLELAKRFEDFNIEVIVHSNYNISNIETDEQDTVTKITKCILNSEEIKQKIGTYLPRNPDQIEDILYNNIWDNEWLADKLMEGDIVVQELPDYFYDDDWDNEWDDLQIEVKILDKTNESFEFGPEDIKLAKQLDYETLGTGAVLTDKHLGTGGDSAYKIIGFYNNQIELQKGNIINQEFVPISKHISNFNIDMIQRKLKSGYRLDPNK